ncbi:hypothetical protein [Ochrobactrum sp. POC9]|uniref:hypothetical protein n=1 Tax=Ochrobactrum sp. POC9 TaxID=2203419 RepID=UPI0011B24C61|nr:hypothetical protein [Ochrobactrum sp. POC9]
MNKIFLIITMIFITGCQTQPVNEMSYSQQKAWAQGIAKKCIDQGISYNHPEFKACIDAESRRDAASRYRNSMQQQRTAQALSTGFTNAGAAYSNAANSNRHVNCTSTRYPSGAINTRCY